MTHPVYLISGEEFLVDEALERVRSEVGGDALSEVTFDSATPVGEVLVALSTPSLFGDRRLIVIRDAHNLKRDQVEAIVAYLESPSPHSVLVLVASSPPRHLVGAVKQRGAVLSLEPLRGRRLVSWLKERARTYELAVDDRGAWALIDSVGSELRELDAALQQISTRLGAGARAGADDVRRFFPRLADERIYAFTDAVGDRRLDLAMGTLRRLLDQGDEPLVLFGALTAHMRRMLVARSHAEQGARDIGDALGLPDWRAQRLLRQVRSYKPEELVSAIDVLAGADVEMKGGDVPPEMALEKAVIEIVGAGRLAPS